MGQPPPQMGNTLQLLHSSVYTFFSRVISVVFICLCFKVSNSLQIYEEQRQYANFFAQKQCSLTLKSTQLYN